MGLGGTETGAGGAMGLGKKGAADATAGGITGEGAITGSAIGGIVTTGGATTAEVGCDGVSTDCVGASTRHALPSKTLPHCPQRTNPPRTRNWSATTLKAAWHCGH